MGVLVDISYLDLDLERFFQLLLILAAWQPLGAKGESLCAKWAPQ